MPIQSEKADIETSSENYAKRFSGKVGEYFLSVQWEKIISLLKKCRGTEILDVGGGHAQVAVPLIKNNFRVTVAASDVTCRKRLDRFLNPNSFNFVSCNLLSLPFEDKSFDAVTCFRLITHEPNWQLQISELCRVARYSVIVDYPDIRSFNFFYKILFKIKKKFEGNTRTFRNFSRKELVEVFKKNNFNNPVFEPQFFLPMVAHRAVKNIFLLKSLEKIFSAVGITKLLGSPVILRVTSEKHS